MVLLSSLEEWQKQSALLLQARPTTARITTKYNIPNLSTPRYTKPASKRSEPTEKVEEDRTPRATITLKTYDTVSGVVLKFKTDRAADVGRLIAGLGTLGRRMAALPEKTEAKDVHMANPDDPDPLPTNAQPDPQTQQHSQSANNINTNANASSKKKKKKGKK